MFLESSYNKRAEAVLEAPASALTTKPVAEAQMADDTVSSIVLSYKFRLLPTRAMQSAPNVSCAAANGRWPGVSVGATGARRSASRSPVITARSPTHEERTFIKSAPISSVGFRSASSGGMAKAASSRRSSRLSTSIAERTRRR